MKALTGPVPESDAEFKVTTRRVAAVRPRRRESIDINREAIAEWR